MSNTILTEHRICTILREKLYSMADSNSQRNYQPLQLKPTLPLENPQGMISILENIIFVLGYVQKNECSKECIDMIIENDISPMVSEIRDEYDFILASVIFVIYRSMENFSDVDKAMKLAKNILGDFIKALEEFEKQNILKENYLDKNQDVQDIDTSGLEIGMVLKNYKELCGFLGQEIKTGKAKQLQIEDFKRYFDFEKSGQKFIIIDIYDEPLTKEDKRRLGNNNIYVKYIEVILLQYLSKQDGYTKTFTKRNWWELLGMVNRKYKKIPKEQLTEIDYTITSFEIDHFYQRCNKKLEAILFSALNNLKRRKLLIWELQTVIVVIDENGKMTYFLADDESKKKILQVERYVLNKVMGYEKIIQVFCRFKQNEYYKKVNQRLEELYGWHHYFKQIKLIYTPEDVLEAIQQSEIDLQKAILNEKIIKVINDNAEEKYNKEKQKWEKFEEDLIWGDNDPIEESKVWDIPDTYLEAQRILTDELINIGHKNNQYLLEQFDEEDEFNQLLTSFIC